MSKTKTIYICSNCGAESVKWIGKCPSCGNWNTYVEEISVKSKNEFQLFSKSRENHPLPLSNIESIKYKRIETHFEELNRILGGGIVPGSLILLGGEPGIGKSTLVLQVVIGLNNKKILYISGEESPSQIKLRAERIASNLPQNCFVYSEVILENILKHIEKINPEIIIVDSIQTIYSDSFDGIPGGVSQIKACAAKFLQIAKEKLISIVLIGHITKDGFIAGPKILEHIVDCVLMFEGDKNYFYRMIKTIKNRYGATPELAFFEMHEDGLHEIKNPSTVLVNDKDRNLSGTAVAVMSEGSIPILIEVQSLTGEAIFGTPQRSTTGFDVKRLNMLLAVMEKRAGFKIYSKDIFINITGGIKVVDPGVDLAIIASLISSYYDTSIKPDICFAAEVGLTGEVRPIIKIEERIKTAEKAGFKRILVSSYNNVHKISSKEKIEIIPLRKIEELIKFII